MRLLAFALIAAFVPLSSSATPPHDAPIALGESGAFPLLHTHLDAEVAGPLADVAVVQLFGNAHGVPIEVIYTFPLPADAAVVAFAIRTGERVIRGRVVEREEAKRIYDEARDRGSLAARLDEERPNVFTQRIANVLPGETVEVELRFSTAATWLEGRYELALPLVVGPRYHPGTPLPTSSGEGVAPDTDRVGDASLLSPPVSPDGVHPAQASLRVRVEAGVEIGAIESPSHSLQIARTGAAAFEVAVDGTLPNQDFVLRWAPRVRAPEVSLIAHRSSGDGAFLLQIQPPPLDRPGPSTPREIVLLVDSSGSMSGHPIHTARAVSRAVLENLEPQDVFQIIDFSQAASSLSPSPLAGTAENVARGIAHLQTLRGTGGTEMLAGIRAALAPPRDPRRLRIVLLLTDGYIGNEHEILAEVRQLLGGARLFALGVGTAVNRFLLDELAVEGRGAVDYVRPDEDTDEVAARFRRRIERPVLTDLVLEADGVRDLQPRRIPDLFAGQPLTIFGRYEGHGPTELMLRGRSGGRPWARRIRVELPAQEERFSVLAAAWARAAIGERVRANWPRPDAGEVKAIQRMAIEHQIVTSWTSFVAVEEGVRTGEEARRIVQPLPLPAGVDFGRKRVASTGLLGGLRAADAGASGLGIGGLGSRGGGRGDGGSGLGLGALRAPSRPDAPGMKEGRKAPPRLVLRKVEGDDPAEVAYLARRDLGELRACYERTGPHEPGADLHLRIAAVANGAARLAFDGEGTPFERCARAVVARWRLPPGVKSATMILRWEP